MTPNPPASSDGSALPPRHRLNMGNLAKDTTEQDLWAFDDTDPLEEETTEGLPEVTGPGIPDPRDAEKMKVRQLKEKTAFKSGGNQDLIRVNITKPRPKLGPSTSPTKPGSEFDDLDHWDEPEATRPLSESSPEIGAPAVPFERPAHPESPPAVTLPTDLQDEFSPVVRDVVTPVSLRLRLNLTRLERLGLVVLFVLLLIGGAMAFFYSINRLPTGSGRVMATDFPIRGKHLTIVTANSFWRAPKTADTARRGTQLVPVVDLTSSGEPAAIRVFFRNGNGDVIGDAVTRFLQSGAKLQIAATAGFDDVGMHAAYRTGENKPWTIEVLEAATENAPGQEFRRLFEMNISTDRR